MAKKSKWVKSPEKSDIIGIDAPRRIHKEYEEIAALITTAQRIKKECAGNDEMIDLIDKVLKELRVIYSGVRIHDYTPTTAQKNRIAELRKKISYFLRDIRNTCNA